MLIRGHLLLLIELAHQDSKNNTTWDENSGRRADPSTCYCYHCYYHYYYSYYYCYYHLGRSSQWSHHQKIDSEGHSSMKRGCSHCIGDGRSLLSRSNADCHFSQTLFPYSLTPTCPTSSICIPRNCYRVSSSNNA